MRRRIATLGAACACLLAISLAAQQGTFRAGVELVSLSVTVTDGTKDAKYVTGLEQDDFEVYEDGVKQAITFFSRVQQPIALAILLDTSNSMEEKLMTAQEAAIGFVKRMRKDDAMEVIEFNSQVRIPQPFTTDQNALERAIRQTTVNGSTSLYNAIYVSLRELKKQRASSAEEIRRQAIVVLSDGDDTSSLVEYRRSAEPGQALRDRDLRDRAAPGRNRAAALQGSRVRASPAVAGDRWPRVLPDLGGRAGEDLRADLGRTREPVQHCLHLEEPDAQRRLAPRRRPDGQARTDGSRATGLFRT